MVFINMFLYGVQERGRPPERSWSLTSFFSTGMRVSEDEMRMASQGNSVRRTSTEELPSIDPGGHRSEGAYIVWC